MLDKKAAIFQSARDIFYSKGFKETNVSEIAKSAGIGVGTFYNYYSSKEQLFLEVYFKENEELKKKLMESMDFNEDPVTLITKMVTENAVHMNSNPILKEWYNKELFRKLEQQFYEDGGLSSFDELTHGGRIDMIRTWKAEGKIREDIDDEMINAIFTSILYIDIHKSEIGIEHFPQLLVYVTEFIMKGLAERPKS
ncbi:TetR/AcrR family transcriptional regulator [Paenibacillus macerans]|uniref:TetR/AcrR family transcriptional regulator n=1 Tax=Paenibacillus macerans TaxID=44252 RepID=UPI003D31994C